MRKLLYSEEILQEAIKLTIVVVPMTTTVAVGGWVSLALARVWMTTRAWTTISSVARVMVMVMLSRMAVLPSASMSSIRPATSRLVPGQTINKTWSVGAAARCRRLLEAINYVPQVHGTILLVVLVRPALNALLIKIGFLEWVQEQANLLLDLILTLLSRVSRLRSCRGNLDLSRQ